MPHQSHSGAQQDAEPVILKGVARSLGVDLARRSLPLPNGSRPEVDGVTDDGSVLVEVYAHQGKLDRGHLNKVARDALKLITIARSRSAPTKLVLAFADEEAVACVTGASWLAEALSMWNVDVLLVEVDTAVRNGVRAAQARQVMVNPAGQP